MQRDSGRLELLGFNNLTKSLSFNIYDICYGASSAQQIEYLGYIDEVYSSTRLSGILGEVCEIIGATILNIATQDYEPRGASATLMIAEEPFDCAVRAEGLEPEGPRSGAVVAHLDKSHMAAHTYPERHPQGGISTFRVDIDVSTCGRVSPLKALNHLIASFGSPIVVMDYRVRGFTRDVSGVKHFMDHPMDSIQGFICPDTLARYRVVDANLPRENLFHSRMMLKTFDLDQHLFGSVGEALDAAEQAAVERRLRREMVEIFSARGRV